MGRKAYTRDVKSLSRLIIPDVSTSRYRRSPLPSWIRIRRKRHCHYAHLAYNPPTTHLQSSQNIIETFGNRRKVHTMSSAQQNFRSQLSGFRWANSVQDDSPAAPPQGVLGRAWGGLSGYIPLRNEGRSQEEEAYFALSVRCETPWLQECYRGPRRGVLAGPL